MRVSVARNIGTGGTHPTNSWPSLRFTSALPHHQSNPHQVRGASHVRIQEHSAPYPQGRPRGVLRHPPPELGRKHSMNASWHVPSPSLTTTVAPSMGPGEGFASSLRTLLEFELPGVPLASEFESSTTAARGAIRRLCSKLKAVARQWDIRVRTRNQLIMCLLIQRLV
jgi:hypothetical protein